MAVILCEYRCQTCGTGGSCKCEEAWAELNDLVDFPPLPEFAVEVKPRIRIRMQMVGNTMMFLPVGWIR